MGSSVDWQPIVDALGNDAYCLTVDLPGHGRSLGRPAHLYTMEGVTQALADVLDDAGIDCCTLVGYSMGGRVALSFSTLYPDRVRRLVLESASPGLPDPAARSERRSLDGERAKEIEKDLVGFLEKWYRQPLFASLERHGLIEEMVTKRGQNDPAELARALRGLSPGRQESLWDRLTDLPMPTLLLAGVLDEKYDRITERVARQIEHAHRVLVPEAGHNVHAERPQAFLAHLVRFLNST